MLCYITEECINYLAMNIKAIKTEALLGSKESNRNLQVIHLTHLQLRTILEKNRQEIPPNIHKTHSKYAENTPKKKAKNDTLW